jgi:hypothetical protein
LEPPVETKNHQVDSPKRMKAVSFPPTNPTAYCLAGLRIVSDLPLAELYPCHDTTLRCTEVAIRRAEVPKSLASIGATFADGQCNANELLLNIPKVARYLLRGGTEILVDAEQTASHGDVCAYLLGTIFGVLCHQRGITPLHASAIDVADGCVAFIGDSGAGKSTLVATMLAGGHQLIADDVSYLKLSDTGAIEAWPGLNRLRLWEDSMIALGCDGLRIERVWQGWKKYFIPVQPPNKPSQPRRLRRVYQLHAASTRDGGDIIRLQGATAMEALMQNVYRLSFAQTMGHKPAAFAVCAAVAREVPVFRFSRPWGFDVLHDGVALLQDHLRDIC